MGMCPPSAGMRVRTIIQPVTAAKDDGVRSVLNSHLPKWCPSGRNLRLAHSWHGPPLFFALVVYWSSLPLWTHQRRAPEAYYSSNSCQAGLCWPLAFPKSFHLLKDTRLLSTWTFWWPEQRARLGPADSALLSFLKRQWRVMVGDIGSPIWLPLKVTWGAFQTTDV